MPWFAAFFFLAFFLRDFLAMRGHLVSVSAACYVTGRRRPRPRCLAAHRRRLATACGGGVRLTGSAGEAGMRHRGRGVGSGHASRVRP